LRAGHSTRAAYRRLGDPDAVDPIRWTRFSVSGGGNSEPSALCCTRRGPARALIGGEPIAQADAKTPNAFHAPNARGEFGAEKAGISGLVGDTPDGGEPQVDRRRRVVTLLEVNAIAENHCPVEREARLGTVPRDELVDCVVVRPLTTGRREAV
jgi:hypothetical protein